MAVRVSMVALPRCGARTTFSSVSRSGCTSGSRSYTSSAAPAINRFFKRPRQGALVDDRPPRRVDKICGPLHSRQLRLAYQMTGVRASTAHAATRRRTSREVDRAECHRRLAMCEPPSSRTQPPARRPHARCGRIQRCRAVSRRAACRGTDRAPSPLQSRTADQALALAEPPGDGENQRDREVGRRVGEDSRRVRDDDAALARGGDVDVVVADADIRDDAELRYRPRSRPLSTLSVMRDIETMLAGDPRDQLVVGRFPSPSNRSTSHDVSRRATTEEGSLRVRRMEGFIKCKLESAK